jgi:hypothetical protein
MEVSMRFASALLAACLALIADPASAQGTPAQKGISDPTPTLQRVGEVYVQESGAQKAVRGRLGQLSPSTLTLLVDGQPRDIPIDRVLRIDARGDSVKNGAAIGAVVMGAWCLVVCGQGVENGAQGGALLVSSVAYGAMLGAGIDALHTGRTTIYRKPGEPGVTPGGPRPSVSFRWRF